MQYTKPMIELVYEIRRFVPSDMKPGIKLANPELFEELSDHYNNNAKTVTKALIKELFTLAGTEWLKLLAQPERPVDGYKIKSYRGVISVEKNEQPSRSEPSTHTKPKRIYRGQVIA